MPQKQRPRLATRDVSGPEAQLQAGEEARDDCLIVKQSSSVRYSGQENLAMSEGKARRRSSSERDPSEDKIPATHAPAPSPGRQAGLFSKSPGLFEAMEAAVSEIASELGSAMDRWGGRIETKVEELLPGWVPPVSAFDEALSREAAADSPREAAAASPSGGSHRGQRPTGGGAAAAQGWDAWDWSQEQPDRRQGAGSSPSRQEAAQRACSRQRGGREVAELQQPRPAAAGRPEAPAAQPAGGGLQGPRMPPIPTQAYQQLQQTLVHLLRKHEALQEQNARLLAENQTLQGMVELMAAQQQSDDAASSEAGSEAGLPAERASLAGGGPGEAPASGPEASACQAGRGGGGSPAGKGSPERQCCRITVDCASPAGGGLRLAFEDA